MTVFIKIPDSERIILFNLVRDRLNIPYDKIYPKFNISRAMFFNYLSGKYDLPKDLFLELEKIAEKRIVHNEINKNKFLKKEIKKPSLSPDLAEIIGVLNGDGYISSINHEISVVGSAMESDYLSYLKKLFENNLNLEFAIRLDKTKFKLRAYSKKMSDYLVKEYDLPRGNKLGKLKIPVKLFKSHKLLISYIRGLFDTDGSFYLRRNQEPVIEITSADPRFLGQVYNTLRDLGFKARISNTNLYIYNKKDIERFFYIIKPANSKHLKKYRIYVDYLRE